MSKALLQRPSGTNVNVTLEPVKSPPHPLAGKRYPCSVCGNGLELGFTRKNKPYTTCLDCGIQTFFRGKAGIERLTEIVNSKILIEGNGSETDSAVVLFNRIQQLRAQSKQLTGKRRLIMADPDLQNAIRVVENEIRHVQDELSKLAGCKIRRENTKQ